MIRIAVDAMGGDNAPEVIVEGALLGIREFGAEVILIGKEREIRNFLPSEFPKELKIRNASEKIEMNDSVDVIRTKKDASLNIAAMMVENHSADALVSIGNTAATVGVAILTFGRILDVKRPAIAVLIPALNGPTILLDAGAVTDCSVENILQFALMGSAYAEIFLEKENPKVGLLSIGEEGSKGNKLTLESHERLSKCPLHFIGNVEGSNLFDNTADVIVTDGFPGNIALKSAEGSVEWIKQILKGAVGKGIISRLALGYLAPILKEKMDYSRYGGALLLGVSRVCVIGHGRSNPQAVSNAIRVARDAVDLKLNRAIENALANHVLPAN